MGLFSNLFSKQACELCGKEVGALGRVKLRDNTYICKECRKETSAFIKLENYTLEEVKKHIEYMKKQNELYEKEFATLPKDKFDKALETGMEYATENRSKYTKISDGVEKNFMGKTFREFLEEK